MAKNVLYVRSSPFDLNPNSYNAQEIGMGKAFVRAGYNFDLYSMKSKDQNNFIFYEQNGCIALLCEIPRFRLFRWGINLSICDTDFLSKYDIILCSEYMQIMTYLLSRKTNNLSVYSGPYYNLFTFKFFSPIFDFLFTQKIDNRVNNIFTKSDFAKDFLEKKNYHKLTTVGVGLDFSRFEQEIKIDSSTQSVVDFMKANKCILYVGSLSERKNFLFMLDVYKRVLEKDPTVKFVIIGKSVINPLYKLLGKKDDDYEKKYMDSLPSYVRNGIYRVKAIPNPQLKFIYPLAKAFLLPSKLEIFGMVLLEAMYLGAPVISSLNGGSKSLIEGKDSGIIIEDFSSEKWADAVLKLLINESYCKDISTNARQVVAKEYVWDVIVDKMLKKCL